jgi:hypothetical protein
MKDFESMELDREVKQEAGPSIQSMDAIAQFENMEQKDWIDRREAQVRAGKLDVAAEHAESKSKGAITLANSAFGLG